MSWISTLTPWQWGLMGMIPVGIVLLYFLKLRREPVEVPSTYLWSRTVEDLHVNSLLQRLRRNLLLLLQLLAVALAAIALLRPGQHGESSGMGRSVFLLDTSASMMATDVADDANRFEQAKRMITERIGLMNEGDQAMLVTFDDRPEVLQSFTSDRSRLLDALGRAEVSTHSTDVLGALKAADGLANPKRSSEVGDVNDVQVADAMPADLLLFTDGGFQPVTEFNLGNLVPEYVGIGNSDSVNLAITAFSAERNVDKPQEVQIYATIVNFSLGGDIVEWVLQKIITDGEEGVASALAKYGISASDAQQMINAIQDKDKKIGNMEQLVASKSISESTLEKLKTTTSTSLYLGDTLVDASSVTLAPGEETGVSFTLTSEEAISLKLELDAKDVFMLDNVAFAGLTPMRTVSVLVLTEGNTPLELGMSTEMAAKICNSDVRFPDYMETDEYKKRAAAGVDDLIIYDRCKPETMPATNTFFVGELPDDEWSWDTEMGQVVLIDLDRTHPLMRYLELYSLRIFSGRAIKGPPGTANLVEADIGPMLCLHPRDGFQDLVLGFEIIGNDKDGNVLVNTNWYTERSWPVFVLNLLRYLAGAAEASGAPSYRPGETVRVRVESALAEVEVGRVGADPKTIQTQASGIVEVIETETPGNYRVEAEEKLADLFAVNLFDHRESDLTVAPSIDLGYEAVTATTKGIEVRREYWRLLLLLMLAIIAAEWWLYNKRVA